MNMTKLHAPIQQDSMADYIAELRQENDRLRTQITLERERADKAFATVNLVLGEIDTARRISLQHIDKYRKKHVVGIVR